MSGWKRQLWKGLRLLVALGGLSFILSSITWGDRIVVPAGVELPDGRRLREATAFPVIVGTPEEGGHGPGALGELTILIDEDARPRLTLAIDPSALGTGPEDFHLRPGLLATLRSARVDLVALALVLVGLMLPLRLVRWCVLVRARGLDMAPGTLFRLMMVGNFFNFFMPGTHGGDLVKILYVVRRSERRADAAMTVVADRVAGLSGLLVLGAVAGVFVLADPVGRLAAASIWASCAALGGLALVVFSRRTRRWLGGGRLVVRLPGRTKLEGIAEAALAYREHKGAFLIAVSLSVAVHGAIVLATALSGYALGMRAPLELVVAVLPVLYLAGALPVTYHGLGIKEGLGMALLVSPPLVTNNHVVGMLLMIRLLSFGYSLLGAFFLARGNMAGPAGPLETEKTAPRFERGQPEGDERPPDQSASSKKAAATSGAHLRRAPTVKVNGKNGAEGGSSQPSGRTYSSCSPSIVDVSGPRLRRDATRRPRPAASARSARRR